MLEVEYPLGTEVYRDENGSIFVVPGCEKGDCTLNLLRLQDDNGKSLEALLEKKFLDALAGEIVPRIELDEEPWWGQDPGWKSKQSQGILQFNDEYPPVAEHLKPVESGADPQRLWQDWQNQRAEVCTVCGLRPQSPKIRDRHICEVCNERRARRVRGWLEDLSTTVWINEVADDNARVALIVGRFDLTHWLDGTLVRTLRVTDPASPTPPKYVTEKIPSFVRLHRILNTTRRFWQELCPTDPEVNMKESVVGRSVQPRRPRLEIQGAFSPAHPATSLERYQAYELVLERGIALSVVWDEDGRRFITCDNLDYLESERQLGWSIKEILQGATVRIEQPVGYGAQNRLIGDFVVSKVDELAPEYLPVIPLLAEPQTFMALVPADRAIEVVKGIKAKYEQEMGKVRNRLPLHLGVVFAHRRTPLRAILDAGRRMLKQHAPAKGWEIVCAARKSIEKQDPLPERFQKEGKDHFKEWLEVTLKKEDRQLVWNVPLLMGDGQTRDNWYPYIFLDQTVEPTGRRRAFQALNPWTDQKQWLVHVEDLKPGDTVFFTPATFDWVWLDSNARRFEIAYDGQVQRRSSHQKQRPYLLDELETLESIWQTLESHLHRAQIHMLRETIEAKRAAWGFPYDETFRRFCRDLLAEAEWRRGTSRAPKARRNKLPWEVDSREKGQWLERWADYAARGWLSDAVELYGEILKARGGEGEEEREPVRAEVKGR
ncbi:MAG: hypothetical protein KatS3mg131_1996 [Candidatus Tectimicrobiota bacterium]|nr:MAG: hypothetical protein KatS3mg131_1996 [Candidatus Tectomicrobia bacterium]